MQFSTENARYTDFNDQIRWQEYPLPHIGAVWQYNNLRTGEVNQARIHVGTILSGLTSWYILGMQVPPHQALKHFE